jgi:hydroxyethylthiazole kinase-like uncharacterized protein yjeF
MGLICGACARFFGRWQVNFVQSGQKMCAFEKTGGFVQVLASEKMRDHEAQAMAGGAVSGLELMETAGAGAVRAVLAQWPALGVMRGRALVLCGPGNNGGDGYVIARLLHRRGWQVQGMAYGDPEQLPPDARQNAQRWLERGATCGWNMEQLPALSGVDLVVDAVFGLGLTRPVPEDIAGVLSDIADWRAGADGARIVAVDCPSGLDLERGRYLGRGAPMPADLTVTFHGPKPGHLLGEGPSLCGALRVVDIGLAPHEAPDAVLFDVTSERPQSLATVKRALPKLCSDGHKYDFGHAWVWGGGVGRGGAGRLAARAALRVGAGLVTVLSPAAALQENAARLDAVMLRRCPDPQDLATAIDDRVTALCLGPGLGLGEGSREMVFAALALKRRTVLDADALTVGAETPAAFFDALHENCVLTPHDGEFRRLFPDLAPALKEAATRIDAVREAARQAGCVVLLKGPATLVADAGGRVALHAAVFERRCPWLATAGSGDVLAGIITGLAAAGGAPLAQVAACAAWLHVEAGRAVGPGLIAEDLPEALPQVLRQFAE